jgi:ribosomal protein S12 methylthiotransferase accessory factor
MVTQNEQVTISYRGRSYQSPKYISEETLHAHSTSIEDTFRIIEPYLKKAKVTRLCNVTGLDRIGIPVFNAVRPNLEGYAVQHGKGLTPNAAKLSAAMESLERYFGTETEFPTFTATYRALQNTYTVIPLDKLPLTSKSFFHPDLPIKWSLGWDIIHQEEVPVPLEVVSLRREEPPDALLVCHYSSNGLASGTNLLEVIIQALYEVIERDAVACSHFAAIAVNPAFHFLKQVLIETIPYPQVNALIKQIEAAGILPVLTDCTVDTAVPTYNCYLYDQIDPFFGVTHGMGTSLDPCTAMIRAIMEATQARAALHAGVRDIFFHDQYRVFKAVDAQTSIKILQNEEGQKEKVDVSGIKSEATVTFAGDIAICLKKLQQIGLDQVIVFELTEPDSDLMVVKLIVPGLEGFMNRYYTPGPRAKAYFKRQKTL